MQPATKLARRAPYLMVPLLLVAALHSTTAAPTPILPLAVPVWVDEFQDTEGWTNVDNDDANSRYGREDLGADAEVLDGRLVVKSFGRYTQDWHGPVLRQDMPLHIPPELDFELAVSLDSGEADFGEILVVLVDQQGEKVGGVAWISTCGTGSGHHHFMGEREAGTALDGAYVGCGSEAPVFEGTLALRRQGTTWVSLVDGVQVHEGSGTPTRTAVAVEVLMTKPFDLQARELAIDWIRVSLLVPPA